MTCCPMTPPRVVEAPSTRGASLVTATVSVTSPGSSRKSMRVRSATRSLMFSRTTVLKPFACFGTYRLVRPNAESRGAMDRLFLMWAVGSLILLHSLPRKYDRYLLFVYPVLAILAAYGLRRSAAWAGWQALILPNLGWASAVTLSLLQLFHVQFHPTAYPELRQAIPMISKTVYAIRSVSIPVQCNIRFFTEAKVKPIDESEIPNLQPGDILVLPGAYTSSLPPHQLLARGKELTFIKVD